MNLQDPFLLQVVIGAAGAISVVLAFIEILADVSEKKTTPAPTDWRRRDAEDFKEEERKTREESERRQEVTEPAQSESDIMRAEARNLIEQSENLQEQSEKLIHTGDSAIEEADQALEDYESNLTAGSRVTYGLTKTRSSFLSKLSGIFSSSEKKETEKTLSELEDLLVLSDVGVGTAKLITDKLRQQELPFEESAVKAALSQELVSILGHDEAKELTAEKVDGELKVVLVIGVNGAGKTTTIAKLTKKLQSKGAQVTLAAGDTFRAAAVQQLRTWGDRLAVEVVAGAENAKPSTVVFDAIKRAKSAGSDVLIIDTAGRLHTRSNLMKELESIVSIIGREVVGAPHETLLVVDGTSGQNALVQAREFSTSSKAASSDVTGVIVTKLDGTPKGGVVVSIKQELDIPVRYIGVGEQSDDLVLFNPNEFVHALLEGSVSQNVEFEAPSAASNEPKRKVNRRRKHA